MRGELAARVVVHDEDGDWLVGDGINDPNEEDGRGLFHLVDVVMNDPSIQPALGIPSGFAGTRDSSEEAQVVSPWVYDDK